MLKLFIFLAGYQIFILYEGAGIAHTMPIIFAMPDSERTHLPIEMVVHFAGSSKDACKCNESHFQCSFPLSLCVSTLSRFIKKGENKKSRAHTFTSKTINQSNDAAIHRKKKQRSFRLLHISYPSIVIALQLACLLSVFSLRPLPPSHAIIPVCNIIFLLLFFVWIFHDFK